MIIHPTPHPRIVFAKGDLFSEESLFRFDGILAFAEGFRGINVAAGQAFYGGRITCPNRIHGVERPREVTALSRIGSVIHDDLDYFAAQGCMDIGAHFPDDMPRAKAALRAVLHWFEAHPDAPLTLTCVDMKDDYYNCFGLDSFGPDRGVCNPSPTPFESYFEHAFREDLALSFGRMGRMDGYPYFVVTKDDVKEKLGCGFFFPVEFSVGLFYTSLIPQLVAKAKGDIQDMYAFSAVSGMPLIDRLMLGYASPYKILLDTGLLPTETDIEQWISLARKEAGYFKRVLIHYLVGGIQHSRKAAAARLARLQSADVNRIYRAMVAYLDAFEACLRDGGGMPERILPEKMFKND